MRCLILILSIVLLAALLLACSDFDMDRSQFPTREPEPQHSIPFVLTRAARPTSTPVPLVER